MDLQPMPRKLPSIHIGRPQQLALLLLLFFLCECLFVVNRQQLSTDDYRYALCGRQMWERPSPLAGYFTTCGNLNGDGTFAYRMAGLPLTTQRLVLLGIDRLRKPENRLYPGQTLNGSTWESRHQLWNVKYLMHLPFVFFAMWLGGGVWWVARRLFGNEGGFLALGLYVCCPAIVASAVVPNNDVLAMWGLYGVVYTAIGVAHAMQGPRRKWRPRILLLTLALGLTAAAHLLAAIVGFMAAVGFMMYLAERRRSYVLQILIYAALGALGIVFVSYSFRLQPFSYVFTGGAARFWFSTAGLRGFLTTPAESPLAIGTGLALVLWVVSRRSRYFGNTTPLLMVMMIGFLMTTQIVTRPWLWALPFLFTFTGGVFSDVLEGRYRRLYLAIVGLLLVAQAVLCVASLMVPAV